MLTITTQQVDNLIASTEATMPDLAPDIRPGDWVRVSCNAPAYQQAHVTSIDGNGDMILAYGSRDEDKLFWLRFYGCQVPVSQRYVTEHWRRVPVVNRSTFASPTYGAIDVTEVTDEWRQIV